ncbi:hypothetical protein U9M48_034503 [Paspalum notatum var. saurae]|uniref:Uncharacterized protein n=1 Tax=Paspalum notatum var. saurae TaxID=547442 RepID=A0AAQ3U961_PASNO
MASPSPSPSPSPRHLLTGSVQRYQLVWNSVHNMPGACGASNALWPMLLKRSGPPASYLCAPKMNPDKYVNSNLQRLAFSTTPQHNTGNKENISEDGAPTVLDCPAMMRKEGASPPIRKKKPAGFNLRKSIAWNPAFFTEEGVLDNSELSVLTGSQLLGGTGSPAAGVRGVMSSPFCRSGSACVRKGVAENSSRKLPAKYCTPERQGKKLFSSAKTPQKDQRREPMRKVPNSSSTAQMLRIPKNSQASLPTVPRNTTVLKSDIKFGPVKAEQIHSVPGLPPKSKVNPVSSGSSSSIVKDVVPAIMIIGEEASGSMKYKNFVPQPQISPSSAVHGPASTFAKPSALRMPSPSVGFFTQENAHVSHGDAAKRNEGRCFVGKGNTSVVKPPRYKLPEDLKSRHLTKPLSTQCTAASKLLVLPVTRESNPNNLVDSKMGSSSKAFSAHTAKYGHADNKKRPDVDCLLAGSGATTQPPIPENSDAARNSMPVVYSNTSHVERRPITEEIKPIENCYPNKVISICSSTIEPAEDSFSHKSTCSTKHIVGGTLSPSCISSQVCSTNDLTCQSKSESHSSAPIDLKNSYAEDTRAVSLSEGDYSTPCLDFLQGSDSCDHQNIECAASVKSTISAEQVPCCGSSRDEAPDLAESNSDFNNSLCNEDRSASSEPDTDGGMQLETNNALALKEILLDVGHGHNHKYRSTDCSPIKPEAPMPCVERRHTLSVEPNIEDKMVLDTDKLSALEGASRKEKNNALDRSRTNTIRKHNLKNLVPFTEEWLAVMEARGQEILEQKTGAVQNSPPDKTAPEPSPWSPVKRKAPDVGPFDCTKYSKNVRTSDAP